MEREDPDLPVCVEQTLLVWIPLCFLWLCGPWHLAALFRGRGPKHLPRLYIYKQLITGLLFLTAIAGLAVTLGEDYGPGTDTSATGRHAAVFYTNPTLFAVSWLLLMLCQEGVRRRDGAVDSATLFNFWLLLVVCDIFPFQTLLREAWRQSNVTVATMLDRLCSVWFWFGSNRPGFFLGTVLLLTAMVLMYSGGIQSSLSLGPGGDFPRFKDPLLYAFSHEDLSSLLVNIILLLLLGPCQERRWGTAAFLALSILSTVILPPLYTLVIFIGGGETSRICGYSATQLALFTAQCRQVTRRKLLRCVPVWFLPWLYLLLSLLLLPSTPALLHFCAICIGHNYHLSFVGILQELEHTRIFAFISDWACIVTSTRFRLPTYSTSPRSGSLSHTIPTNQTAPSSWPPMRDPSVLNQRPWLDPVPPWIVEGSTPMSEAQLMEEQMLRAGIMASLQDVPEDPSAKVEVAKSSVSSLRLQQLEKMGFPTEKAVVALAASKQLDGAISLLINDRVGDEAVVITKGKSPLPPQGP